MPPRPVTCLLVLLFLFISIYYLGHCSFSPWHSHSGNWNCTKGFLLIVCNVMLQNYYEGKIVKLYIRERLFVEKMHRKNPNAKTYSNYDLSVVWATMTGNECFMIIYIYINWTTKQLKRKVWHKVIQNQLEMLREMMSYLNRYITMELWTFTCL